MKSALLLFAVATVFIQLPANEGARILGVLPFPGKSHMVVFQSLTKELARRGHELVVISAFPLGKPMANYTDINTMPVVKDSHSVMVGSGLYDMGAMSPFMVSVIIHEMGLNSMKAVFNMPEVKALLKDERGFDLVIVEAFANEAVYGFADYFNAPLIVVAPFGGFHVVNYATGNPNPLAYVPNGMLLYSDQMNILQRIHNVAYTLFWDAKHYLEFLPKQEVLRQEFFGKGGRSIYELETYPSIVFMNNHFSMNYPRPFLPNMIEVGGMHVMRKNNKLSNDIQSFLDGAKDGAIFFSMGSNLRCDAMPIEKRNAIIGAFAELPQRILWKWESDDLPGKTDNVKTGKWLPQQDILAHPNIRLFITHGGLLSAQEAIYHGVPVVGIPIFGDQKLNMKKAELSGYGLTLDFNNITKESLLYSVKKVLHDPRYRQEAKRRSAVYRDQPETPLDRAVFWTEYVLRHKGAPHLRSASLQLSWYQLWLLDIVAVLFIILLIAYKCIRCAWRLCCGSSNSQANKGEKIKKS